MASGARSIDKSGKWRPARFEYQHGTPDGQGGLVDNWQPVANLQHVSIQIVPMMAGSQFQAQQIYPRANVRISCRYRHSTNFNTAQRIVCTGHIYVIRGLLNMDLANDMVLFYCEELQASGSNTQ